jgi:catechol 2,3-dioxygenase-like lactoylglutathione lyase family enzyme
MPHIKSVHPISGENTDALPVRDLARAIAYYTTALGFSVTSHDSDTAFLVRDGVRIGVARKENHQPGEAGSVAFAIDDLDAMHRELQLSGASPGDFGVSHWGGKQYRTFFVREDDNGYCYCFFGAT